MLRSRRRFRAILPAILALVTSLFGPHDLLPHAAGASSCGEWRWDVKTLSDPDRKDVDFHERRIKVNQLRNLDEPSSLSIDTPRLAGVEKQVYEVRAQVITAKFEEDSDIHLVIASRDARKQTMIVEFPEPKCVDSPFKRDKIGHARQSMLDACGDLSSSSFTDLKGKVVIRGVGFWDEIHGQTGVAPNGIELHPVLGFRGRCSSASGGGGGGGGGNDCDPAYPTVCIPSPPPDLDCADITYRNFEVLPPDPHHFDGDGDGVGCET